MTDRWLHLIAARELSCIRAMELMLVEPLDRPRLIDGLELARDGVRLRNDVSYGEPLDSLVRNGWLGLVATIEKRLKETP